MIKKTFKTHMMELFFRQDFIREKDKWGLIKAGLIKDFKVALSFTICSILSFLALIIASMI